MVVVGVNELVRRRGDREGRAAENLVTAVKIAKDKDLPIIHRLSKNKAKVATLVLNLVTLDR